MHWTGHLTIFAGGLAGCAAGFYFQDKYAREYRVSREQRIRLEVQKRVEAALGREKEEEDDGKREPQPLSEASQS